MLKKLIAPAVGPGICSLLQGKGYSAMKTVYLVRHAKSSWTDPRLPDKDRPLKGRGIRDAVQMAESFRATLAKPDRIYSSPATRALHTAMLFAQTLGMALDDLVLVDRL
jgi:phosphohistidine phosphatase